MPARCLVCCLKPQKSLHLGLSVLLGVHSPRVDIEVGIDLDRGHVHRLSVKPGCIAALALILRPIVLSSRPVEEAVTRGVSVCTREGSSVTESYL